MTVLLNGERSRNVVKYICFCQMTPDFLRLPLEERNKWMTDGLEIARKHGLKVIFWGNSMGVREHVVVVFESNGISDDYMKFQREWQGLGTPEAGKYIDYSRTVTVF